MKEPLCWKKKGVAVASKFRLPYLPKGLSHRPNLVLLILSPSFRSLYRSLHFLVALLVEKPVKLLELDSEATIKTSKTKAEIIVRTFLLRTVRVQTLLSIDRKQKRRYSKLSFR